MGTRRRCLLAAAIVVLSAPFLAAKVGSFWEDLAPLPTPRQEVGVAASEAHVYVIGGILADRQATGIVERLDVAANSWEGVAPLPEGARLHHVGAAACAGRVFAIGGLDDGFRAVKSLCSFDPSTGEWSRGADLPRARGAMGIAVLEGRIYAAGGQDGGVSFDDLAVYHVLEDRWEALPPLPTARNHLAAAALGGTIYAVGGRARGELATLEAYDVASAEWTLLPPMPTARGGIAAALLDDCIFVFGGEGNDDDPSGVFPQVEGFDICHERWLADLEMPHPRHGIGAAVVDLRIILPGGSPLEGFGVTDVTDAFLPGGPSGGFYRGDANLDTLIDLSDSVFILAERFLGGPPLRCEDAADADDSGRIDITDAIFGLSFLFLGGPPPPAPGPSFPGFDPTDDGLGCLEFPKERCVEG